MILACLTLANAMAESPVVYLHFSKPAQPLPYYPVDDGPDDDWNLQATWPLQGHTERPMRRDPQ